MITLTKTCKDCGENKPATRVFFWSNPKTKDRLKTSCIVCCKVYNKNDYISRKNNKAKQPDQSV